MPGTAIAMPAALPAIRMSDRLAAATISAGATLEPVFAACLKRSIA
jgi:hypothetical protein